MFFIVEQGARIQTPVDHLLQSKGVNEINSSNPTRPISASDKDKDERNVKFNAKTNPYQNSEPDQQRRVVIYAHQIMTSPVVTESVHQTLNNIWLLFSKHGFHHLPLLNDQKMLQGIVSDRDLLRFSANQNREIGSFRIEQLMTPKVISASEQTEIRTIAEVMFNQSIGAIPIVNDHVEVVGIVTRSDILRTLVHHAPLELWA